MEERELLTVQQTADYLQVTRAQVYKLFKKKVNPLPYIKISDSTRRVSKQDIDSWIEQNTK